MAKSIKLKCVSIPAHTNKGYQENNLYKASINDKGEIWVRNPSGKIRLNSNFVGADGEKFAELKTKTLKCISLDHKNPIKKSFKVGKRYQVESGRALGGVDGYIFDEDGCRWTLFREEVGFSIADGTTFEAKYI